MLLGGSGAVMLLGATWIEHLICYLNLKVGLFRYLSVCVSGILVYTFFLINCIIISKPCI